MIGASEIMGIFDEDFKEEMEEELEDIEGDILDLYDDLNGKSNEELAKSHSGYERAYKKILYSLRDIFDQGLFGSGVPSYLQDLIDEIEDPTLVLKTTTITRVKMGIKKLSRKLKIVLPESKESNKDSFQPPQQIIFNANPSMNTSVNVSNDTKIKIESLIQDFNKELEKENPRKKNLWSILKNILKLLGVFLG